MKFKYLFIGLCVVFANAASAQLGVTKPQTESRPMGFRFFNQHLTIKPYVALSYTYDSNIDADSSNEDDSIFAINPTVDFQWHGAKWMLVGNVWYRHRYFCEFNDEMGEDSYGESLQFRYSSGKQSEKGWSLMLSERYAFINQSDDLDSHGGGRGIWRDRQTLDIAGIVERRFTERWHMDIQGQYSWLDYDNQTGRYVPLFGWSQYSAGAQFGYAASKWTDLLVAAGYSRYNQDLDGNDINTYRNYNSQSDSYSIQAGLGTRATERISYRALMGASWFDYAGGSSTDCGWTYTLSANWRVHRQVQFSLLGSSYYEPSDQYIGQARKVYNLSAGVSYLTLGDRLKLTGNIAWRYDETCYSDAIYTKRQSYDRNHISARLAADYLLNRWTSVFAHLIWDDESCGSNSYYDYDRVRSVFGLRLHY